MNNNKDNFIKRNPLIDLVEGVKSFNQRLCVLACIIFYSTILTTSSPAIAAALVTNTATANFSINGIPHQASDSIQFAKDEVVAPSDIITLSKQADVSNAFINDLVIYTLKVTNPNNHIQNNVRILDSLPTNINYQPGSAMLNGTILNASQVFNTAGQVTFNIGNIPANTVWTIRYKAKALASGVAINKATVKTDSASSLQATSSLDVTARTPSTIKFLKINNTGVNLIIPPTAYNSDQNGGKLWQEVNTITLPDGTTITLPTPQPIVEATSYSLLDPIIIEVTDLDQNVNSTLIDTLIIEVEVPGTDDKEILLLQETSPNSGIFRGVVLTTSAAADRQNGLLSLVEGSKISVHYRDKIDSTDTSATVALVVPNATLVLTKTSDKSTAAIGELVKYSLSFTNTTNAAIPNLNIVDTLPLGFKYIPNSAVLNGSAINTGVNSNGRNLNFNLGNMAIGQSWTLEYLTKITAGVQIGNSVNTAYINSGSLQSPKAYATVIIKDDLMRSKNILTGRVYIGCTTGKDARTLKDARIFTETGRSVLTDEEGFWHLEGIQAGTHVLQLDEISLPTKYKPILCEENTRFAGNPASQFVDLQAGTLWHTNFYVEKTVPRVIPSYKSVTIYKDVPVYSEETIRSPFKKLTKSLKQSEKEVFFDLDSAKLTTKAKIKLQEVASTIRNHAVKSSPIFVIGNACGLGASDYDQRLSERRAKTVQLYLEKQGVDTKSFSNTSLGKTKQKYPDTEEERHKNRRVDIKFQTEHKNYKTAYTTETKKVQTGTKKVQVGTRKVLINTNLVVEETKDNQKTVFKHYKEPDPYDLYGKKYLETATADFEILWPKNNYVPAVASTKILIKSSSQHKVEVFLNGKEVSPLNYNGSKTNLARTVTIRRWKGVDVNIKNRNNTLLVVTKDKSGTEISRKTHNIHFSGEATSADFLTEESKLVADGKTIPIIALLPRDEDGFRLRTGSHGYFNLQNNKFQIKTLDSSAADTVNLNESLTGNYKYHVEADGIARIAFNPTTQSGEVELKLKFPEGKSKTIKAWLKPQLRDWILVGLAEGTLAHNKLSGNMTSLTALDKSDSFSKRGRVSFYAQGQVKGKYLLTVAYDTHKQKQEVGSQLNGNIDPDAWYTIYADNSNSQYGAPSSRKLYLKIEKENFYTLFGDFNTGMTITDLASYTRVLNGIKTEYQDDRYSFKAFISETSNNHQHDEIPGDGTSGLYYLTANIIQNSESIKIETRDRFHSDRILESRQLQRYQDYNIDYDTGALFFKFPITGRDQDFNPNIIVVDYDSEEDSNKSISAGGRVSMKSLDDKLETGLSVIHEGRNDGKDNLLVAADLSYDITADTKINAEVAESKTEAGNYDSKRAYIIELEKEIDNMEARLYYKKQDDNFGISAQSSENGTIKAGAELNYKITKKTRVTSEISHEKNTDNNNVRNVAEIGVKHRLKQIEVNAGLRHSKELFNDDFGNNRITTNTLILGGRYTTNNDKVTLRTDLEKSISSNNGSEISPDRMTVGVDVKLKHGFSVFAEHETTNNGEIKTHNNRVGVNKNLWKGAKGRTTYTQERTDEGQRNYATLGLNQNIKLTDKISADFSVDQAKTMSSTVTPNTFNEDEPAIQGSQSDDYTAFSVGLGSNDKDWSWTTRAEYRNGEIEDKINFLASAIRHYENGKDLSAKLSYYNTDDINGDFDTTVKLSFGSAWHPKEKDYVFFNRLDLIHEDSNTTTSSDSVNAFANGTSSSNTNKIIHNMHYNRKISKRSQYSIHHGIKYVEDKNAGFEHKTTVDTATIEYRRDISKRVDIGVHGGYLRDWKENTLETVAGISIGVTPAKNAWAELGYNFEGFDDDDFDKSNYKRKGPYVDFRYKFNQDTIKGDMPVRRKAIAKANNKINNKIKAKVKAKDFTRKVTKGNSNITTPKPTEKITKIIKEKVIKKTTKKIEPELKSIDDIFEQYDSGTINNTIKGLSDDK